MNRRRFAVVAWLVVAAGGCRERAAAIADAGSERPIEPPPLPVPDGEPLAITDAVLATDYYGAAEEVATCAVRPEDESTHAADAAALAPDGFALAYARAGGGLVLVRLALEPGGDGLRPVVRDRRVLAQAAAPWVRAAGPAACADGAACAFVAWADQDGERVTAHVARVEREGEPAFVWSREGARQPAVAVGEGEPSKVLVVAVDDGGGARTRLVGEMLDAATGATLVPAFVIADAASAAGGRVAAKRFHRPAAAYSSAAGRFLVAWDASAAESPGGLMLAALVSATGEVTPAPEGFGLPGEDCVTPCPESIGAPGAALPINIDCRVKALWVAGARAGVGGPPFAFTKYGCGGNGLLTLDFEVTPGPDEHHAYKALVASGASGVAFEWMHARGARDPACAPLARPIYTIRHRFAPGAVDPMEPECGVSWGEDPGQAVAVAGPGAPTLFLHTDRACASFIPGAPPQPLPRLLATVRFD